MIGSSLKPTTSSNERAAFFGAGGAGATLAAEGAVILGGGCTSGGCTSGGRSGGVTGVVVPGEVAGAAVVGGGDFGAIGAGGDGTTGAGFSAGGADCGTRGSTGVAGFCTAGVSDLGTSSEGGRSAVTAACVCGKILISGCAGAIGVGTAEPQRVQYCASGNSLAPHFLQRCSTPAEAWGLAAGIAAATAGGCALSALGARASNVSSLCASAPTWRSRASCRPRAAAVSLRRRLSIVNPYARAQTAITNSRNSMRLRSQGELGPHCRTVRRESLAIVIVTLVTN